MAMRATRRPWHALIESLAADGRATGEIVADTSAQFPELTRSQVTSHLQRVRSAARLPTPADDESPAVREWIARRDAATTEALARNGADYDWARPVDLPLIERKKPRYTPNPCYVISSDHHWPLHDPRAESIILQAIEALRPRAYILNGDGPDMLALSRFPKDARHGKSWQLRDEQVHAKNWWRSVYSIMQEWGGEVYETEANHSGNGQASRWSRWMNENAAALFGLDGYEDLMRYERFFHPSDVPVQMVEEYVIANDLRVRHGEIVRKHGGYSARAHGDKWQSSVMHGHTHRIGSSMKRRPGIPGIRGDEFLRTFETASRA